MLPRYVMFVTSIWANWNILLLEWSHVTCCKNPSMVMVDPTTTLGPSFPHHFFELLSAKCALIGNGEFLQVRMA